MAELLFKAPGDEVKNKKLKVAIVGANGVPASYGGWDQLVEHFTLYDTNEVEFTVYCSAKTNNKDYSTYNNATVRVINLDANGWQSIPYDIISLFYAVRETDVAIVLGTSGALVFPVLKLINFPTIINIDGLEWKRGKWGRITQYLLKLFESLCVKYADVVVTDSVVLKDYVWEKYARDSLVITYGGDHVTQIRADSTLEARNIRQGNYAFKVCRIVPENNIDMILRAFSKTKTQLVLVGNFNQSKYGKNIRSNYEKYSNILLLDPIYDQHSLNMLRSNCGFYVHGHSVGGTNPSLVEAMYLGLNIFAYDVSFNWKTTNGSAHFFRDEQGLIAKINKWEEGCLRDFGPEAQTFACNNYVWEKIIGSYIDLAAAISKPGTQ